MHLFTERDILEATGGVRIGAARSSDEGSPVVYSVSTDTRSLEPGALFVALIGERFDGHTFCQAALEKDASLFLVSDEHMLPANASGVLVPDTLLSLHALARAYRRRLACKVIAVTGSVGKTSTREMLFSSLSNSFRTHATKHNLNNEIGLPLTILSAPHDTELMIVEMGMRKRGEILTLSLIAEPDIAIITNIGVSHIELLGSQEEILLAKMEICEGLSGDRVLLINGDDALLKNYILKTNRKKWEMIGVTSLMSNSEDLSFADQTTKTYDINYKKNGTAFCIKYCESRDSVTVDLGEFMVPCVGIQHVKNALFSIACAKYLGASVEKVKTGFLSYRPAGSRGQIIETTHYVIYDDAYNASPESMAAAFDSVRLIAPAKRKIAVMGGILELGSFALEQHYKVGKQAAISGMNILFVCGDNREDVKAGALSVNPAMEVHLFESREDLTAMLLKKLQNGDTVLVKGSHAFEMGKVTDAIIESENSFSALQRKGQRI